MPNGEKGSSNWPEVIAVVIVVVAMAAVVMTALLVVGHG